MLSLFSYFCRHWRQTTGLDEALLWPTVVFGTSLEVLFIAQTTTQLGFKAFTPEKPTSKDLVRAQDFARLRPYTLFG